MAALLPLLPYIGLGVVVAAVYATLLSTPERADRDVRAARDDGAFELSYLTPPVALNHVLARQLIGPDADVHLLPAEHWVERHEHILLPMAVMGTALLIVAFVPLAFV